MNEVGQAPVLPSFERPPVKEVALAVRFDELPVQVNHVFMLWSRLSERFPNVEQQPTLPPTPPEDLSESAQGGVQFSMASEMPLPRFWLVSKSGNEICQVQRDRLIVNWRRVEDADVYPRYEHVRELLDACVAAFAEVLSSEGLGEMRPFQAEVDYVNQLDIGQGWNSLDDLGRVFSFWNDAFPIDLPTPSAATTALRFLVPGANDAKGRLYLDVSSGRRDDLPILNMALRMRIPLSQPALEAATEAVDFGRTWIVQSFASMTTAEMHEIWGRTR